MATDDDGASAPDAPAVQQPGVPPRPHEAPDHRSDVTYVLVLAITDRQVTYNAILLLGALGAVVCGISATWLLLGSRSPWGVLLTGGGATLMVTAGTARWVVRRMAAKHDKAAADPELPPAG